MPRRVRRDHQPFDVDAVCGHAHGDRAEQA
jgi:hypothetical protein